MLTGYKSIINITLANINMYVHAPLVLHPMYAYPDCSYIAAITLRVLEDYKDLIANTTYNL